MLLLVLGIWSWTKHIVLCPLGESFQRNIHRENYIDEVAPFLILIVEGAVGVTNKSSGVFFLISFFFTFRHLSLRVLVVTIAATLAVQTEENLLKDIRELQRATHTCTGLLLWGEHCHTHRLTGRTPLWPGKASFLWQHHMSKSVLHGHHFCPIFPS